MRTARRGVAANEIQYLVLHDDSHPILLARVGWPDVFHAISPARPEWQSDPGLLDLPYDPSSVVVTPDWAAAIAAEWGAELPAADEGTVSGPSLIRRMPANWSELSPAVKRAWSIEPVKKRRRGAAGDARLGRWRRRGREVSPAPAASAPPQDERILILDVEPAEVIDLTDARQDALTTGEDA